MARVVITKEQWAVAKAMWEGEPLVTFAELAENLGSTRQAVQVHAKRNGWQKRVDMKTVSERAHAAADSKFTHPVVSASTSDSAVVAGLHENRPTRSLPGVPLGVTAEQAGQAVEDAAVDRRAELLGTHRKEWLNVRSLAYASVKEQAKQGGDPGKAMGMAKHVKVIAEALKLVQEGERKAWGLDGGTEREPVRVIVQRQAGKKFAE